MPDILAGDGVAAASPGGERRLEAQVGPCAAVPWAHDRGRRSRLGGRLALSPPTAGRWPPGRSSRWRSWPASASPRWPAGPCGRPPLSHWMTSAASSNWPSSTGHWTRGPPSRASAFSRRDSSSNTHSPVLPTRRRPCRGTSGHHGRSPPRRRAAAGGRRLPGLGARAARRAGPQRDTPHVSWGWWVGLPAATSVLCGVLAVLAVRRLRRSGPLREGVGLTRPDRRCRCWCRSADG
jgi:hypothetical protein